MKDETKNPAGGNHEWLSMSEAAPLTPYSAEYLSLLARKKKLGAKKVGKTWYTTKAILDEYMRRQMIRTQVQNGDLSGVESLAAQPVQQTEVVENHPETPRMRTMAADLARHKNKQTWIPKSVSVPTPTVAPVPTPKPVSKPVVSVAKPTTQTPSVDLSGIEKRLDDISKKIASMAGANAHSATPAVSTPVVSANTPKRGIVRTSFRTVFSNKMLASIALVGILFFTVFPTPFVFAFVDKAVDTVKKVWTDANTVMGFRPGTHANEILLLNKDGDVSITGHIETDGQFKSYAADGVAPIVVDSTTLVKNLNAEMVGGTKAGEFTLAYVTKNGAMTTENVVFGGSVEVGKTLLVRGATKLLSSLQVDGNISVLGDARFERTVSVAGPAYFESLLNTAGNLEVGRNISVRGSIESGSSVIARSASFSRGLSTGGNFSVGGESRFSDDVDIHGSLDVSKGISANSIDAASGDIENLSVSGITGDNATFGNATTTNLYAQNFTAGSISFSTSTIGNSSTTNATILNLTATNATTTSLYATFARIIDAAFDTLSVGALTATNTTAINSTTTNATSTYAYAHDASFDIGRMIDAIITGATITNSTTTNSTTTNAFIQELAADRITTGDITATNATTTNLVATSFRLDTLTGLLSANNGVVGTTSTSSLGFDADFFKQNGNSFGTTSVIGTNDTNALALETDGTTRLTVNAAGNVGIGTTTPSETLTVAGNGYFSGNLTAGNITATGTLSLGNLTGLLFGQNGTVSSIATSSLGLLTTDVAEGSNLYYTDVRARNAISSGIGISYSTTTGVIANIGVLSIGGLAGDVATSSLGLPEFSDLDNYLSVAAWNATTTDALDEGITNLYFTDARADTRADIRIAAATSTIRNMVSAGTGLSYNVGTGVFANTGVLSLGGLTGAVATSSLGLPEFSDLANYLLLSEATTTIRSAISGSSPISYDSGTGVISFVNPGYLTDAIISLNGQTDASQTFATGTASGIGITITSVGGTHTFTPTVSSGYNIPLTASTSAWNTFYTTPSDRITAGTGLSWSGNTLNSSLSPFTTTDLAEGANLYYTDQRVADYITGSSTLASSTNYWSLNGGNVYRTIGNVGIGTSTPTEKLDVNGNIKIDAGSSFAYLSLYRNGSSVGRITNGNSQFTLQAQNSGDINIANTSGTSLAYFANNGNVGIGTTSPSNKLEVGGAGFFSGNITSSGSIYAATGTAAVPGFSFTSDPDTGVYNVSANRLGLVAAGTLLFDVNTSRAKASVPFRSNSAGSAGSPVYSYESDSTTGLFFASGGLGVSTGGTERLRVDSNGNVGVGSTSPSARFAITGTGTGTGKTFSVANSSNAEKFVILDNGSVGIGTTIIGDGTRDTKLHIKGTGSGTSGRTDFIVENTSSNSAASFRLVNSSGHTFSLQMSGSGYSIGEQASLGTADAVDIVLSTNGNTATGGSGDVIFRPGGYADSQKSVWFKPTGNVGIGTSTPSEKLTVNGNGLFTGSLTAANITATGTLSIGNLTGLAYLTNGFVGTTSTSSLGLITTDIAEGSNLYYTNQRVADYLAASSTFASTTNYWTLNGGDVYRASGSVGVGIANPIALLDVNGSTLVRGVFTANDTVVKTYSSFGSNSTSHGLSNGSDVLISGNLEVDGNIFADGGTISFSQASTTNDLQIGGKLLLSDGTANNPSLTFTDDNDTGMYRPSTNSIGLSTAGSERIRIDSLGNIGIGTSSPSEKLTVAGNGYFSGNLVASSITATGTLSSFGATNLQSLTFTNATGTSMVATNATTTNLSATNFRLDTLTGVLYATNGIVGTTSTSSLGLITTDVGEGSNLYFTTDRARSALSSGAGIVYSTSTGAISLNATGDWTGTFDGQEGSWYLDRANHTGTQTASTISDFSSTARGLLSSTAPGLSYTSGTGVFSLTAGYNIPLTASTSAWNTFYTTPSDRITAGTGLSWSGNTLNASLSPFTTTDLVEGTNLYYTDQRVADYITGSSTLASSTNYWSLNGSDVYRTNGNVGIGTSTPSEKLTVDGNGLFTGNLTAADITATGTLSSLGTTNLQSLTFTNATGTSIVATNATSTNFFASVSRFISAVIDSLTVDALTATDSTLTNATITNATITNATITNATTTNATTTDLAATNFRLNTLTGVLYATNGLVGTTSTSSLQQLLTGTSSPLWLSSGSDIYNTNAGNVGIGTNSPSDAVDVYGDTKNVRISNTAETESGLVITDAQDPSNQYGKLLYDAGGAKINFYVNSVQPKLSVLNSGYVGISSSTPVSPFSIEGGSNTRIIDLNTTSSNVDFFTLRVSNTSRFVMNKNSSGDINLTTGSTYNLLLNPGGTVGIGTLTPSAKLDVGGTIRTTGYTTPTSGVGIELYRDATNNNRIIAYDRGGGSYQPLNIDASNLILNNINSSGRVGIGTSTPTEKLDVNGNIKIDAGSSFAYLSLYRNGSSVGRITNGNSQFTLQAQNSGDINIANTSGTSLAYFANNGNVGIGTTSPSSKLTVQETSNTGTSADNASIYVGSVNRNSTLINDSASGYDSGFVFKEAGTEKARIVWNGSNDYLDLQTAGTNRLTISNGGNIGIGTTTPGKKLTVSGNIQVDSASDASVFFTENNANRWVQAYSVSGDYLYIRDAQNSRDLAQFYDNGNTVFNPISGNVGIGTTSPSNKLEVAGSGYFSGNLTGANIMATGTASVANLSVGSLSGVLYAINGAVGTTSTSSLGFDADFFKQNGNSFGTTSVIGTNDTNDLALETDGVTRLTVNTSGNLGVGQTSPTARLHVTGPDTGTSKAFLVTSSSNTPKFTVLDNGTSYFEGGNVGIGTTTPTSKLQVVSGSVDVRPDASFLSSVAAVLSQTSDNPSLRLYRTTGGATPTSYPWYLQAGSAGGSSSFSILTGSSAQIGSESVSEKLTILASGNVGIGTTNPNTPLEVAGIGRFTGSGQFSIGSDSGRNRIDTGGSAGNGNQIFRFLGSGNSYAGARLKELSIGLNYGGSNAPSDGLIVEGNVGIGTTTPTEKLTISGNGARLALRTTSSPTGYATYLEQNYNSANPFNIVTGSAQAIFGTAPADTTFINGYTAVNISTGNAGAYSSSNVKMSVLSNGNVGIGTTSPAYTLDVYRSSSSATARFQSSNQFNVVDLDSLFSASGAEQMIRFNENGTSRWSIGNSSSYSDSFVVAGSSLLTSTPRFLINSSGNVGIGTTTPIRRFSIQGEGGSNVNGLSITHGSEGSTWAFDIGGTANSFSGGLAFSRNGSAQMTITSVGNLGIGTTTPNTKLQVSSNDISTRVSIVNTSGGKGYSLASVGSGSGIGSAGSFGIYDENLGTTRLLIDSSGNVGIGTTSPSERLSVTGNGYFAGNLTAANITATGTLSVSGQSDLNSASTTALSITSSGGTTPLTISKASQTGVRERLLTATVSDDSASSFFINNGTITNGSFAPVFGGYSESATVWPLGFGGYVNASADASDSSNFGLLDFAAFRTTNGSDPLNGTLSSIQNRKIVTFRNNSDIIMTMLANGNVGIGTTTPADKLSVYGTASIKDASGNVILGDTSGSGYGSTTNSLDLQSWRTSSSQIAVGDGSVVIGNRNSTVAGYGISMGMQNIAGNASLAVGFGNISTSTNPSIYGMLSVGYNNQSHGILASAFGEENTVNGSYSSAIGSGNTVYSDYSAAVGRQNVASGAYSSSAFGVANQALSNQSSAFGWGNVANAANASVFGYNSTSSASGASVFGSSITNSIANSVQIGPSNTAKLTILSSGNLGIATTSPIAKLSISGTGNLAALGDGTSGQNAYISLSSYDPSAGRSMFGYNGATSNAVIQGASGKGIEFNVNSGTFGSGTAMTITNAGNVGVGSTSPSARFAITGTGTGTGKTFSVANSSNAEKFVILDNGSVGVGTSNPGGASDALFTVRANSATHNSNTIAYLTSFNRVNSDTASWYLGSDTSNNAVLVANNADVRIGRDLSGTFTDYLRVQNGTGNVGIGSTSPSARLTVTGSGTGTGKAFSIANSSNSEKFTVLDNGNVGLGTSTPSAQLALVGGSMVQKVSGTLPVLGTYSTPGVTFGVTTAGNYAYVSDYSNGLEIYDISNPASTTLVGSYDTAGTARTAVVSGQYAFVADGTNGVVILDVSDPHNPTLVSTYDTPDNVYRVFVSGKYLYATDNGAGFKIFDISDPTSPKLIGSYNTPGNAFGIYVSGKYAYIADYDSGLEIFDVSNPTSPSLVGSYNTSGHAYNVYVSGIYAYVADTPGGLDIFDVSNPASPSLVGNYDPSGDVRDVFVSGNYAYLATGYDGVYVVDISNPASLTVPASYDTSNYSSGISVSGNRIYVADQGTLYIFGTDGIETPGLYAGNVDTNNLTARENIVVNGDIFAQRGLTIGLSGLFSRGGISSYVSSSTASNPVSATFMGGSVGVGTSTPSAQFTTTGTVRLAGFGAGSLQTDASGNVSVSSDERLKDIQGSFSRGLEDLRKINPIVYRWNATSGLDMTTDYAGFSAQNIQAAIPEAVGQGPNGYLTLADRPILAATVNAIKSLDLTLASTTERVANVEERVAALEQLVASSTQVVTWSSGLGEQIISFFTEAGLKLENGIAYITNAIVDSLTANVAYIKNATVDSLSANALTVGSQEKRTGITLFDEVTGEPYCLKINNGSMQSVSGACPTIPDATPGTNPDTNVITTGTTTPDTTATSTSDSGTTTTPTGTLTVSIAPDASTSEGGGTASFTVVLDSEPSQDVTVAISTSNPTEATVNKTSLIFRKDGPTAWNIPQTVTLTGVDDTLQDGPQTYTLSVGPTTSDDPSWNSIPAQTFTLTNYDNEDPETPSTPETPTATSTDMGTTTDAGTTTPDTVTDTQTNTDTGTSTPDTVQP